MTSEPLFPILATKTPAVREVNLIRQAQRYLVWQVLCPWCGWMLVLLSDGREYCIHCHRTNVQQPLQATVAHDYLMDIIIGVACVVYIVSMLLVLLSL